MNTAVCCMYDDLASLGVNVIDLKLKANTAIAFLDSFIEKALHYWTECRGSGF